MIGIVATFALGLAGASLSMDMEESCRTWLLVLTYAFFLWILGGPDLECFSEDTVQPSKTSAVLDENYCLTHGLIPMPRGGPTVVQQWTIDRKLATISTKFTSFRVLNVYLFFATICPLLAYKLITWMIRRLRVHEMYVSAEGIQQAIGGDNLSLRERRTMELIRWFKNIRGNWLTKNLLTMAVLVWSLSYFFQAAAIIHLIMSYLDLPNEWLAFPEFRVRSLEESMLEAEYFPTQFVCLLSDSAIGDDHLASTICLIRANETVSSSLRLVCWCLIAYNGIPALRVLRLVYTNWMPSGKRAQIMSLLDPSRSLGATDETISSFVREWSADDVLAMSLIERRLGRGTAETIVKGFYEAFQEGYFTKRESTTQTDEESIALGDLSG